MTEPEKTRYTEICLPSDEPFSSYSFDTSANTNVISSLSLVNIFIGTNNSGKSRLLRSLFCLKNDKFFYNTNKCTGEILFNFAQYLNKKIHTIFEDPGKRLNKISRFFMEDIINSNILEEQNFISSVNPLLIRLHQKLDELDKARGQPVRAEGGDTLLDNKEEAILVKDKLMDLVNECRKKIENIQLDQTIPNQKRYYIPILRGMRPLDENDQHINLYKDRTLKDYFQAPNPPLPDQEKMIIFTGLELYQTLKEKLLGEPEDRDLVKDFENFLSTKFFNSKPVTLIPKEKGNDPRVVNIKIGNEEQFSISQLGDGLQNLIICTYNIFTEKDRCLFFIEEPDMLMHPSLQRSFLEILSEFDQHQYFITSHSNHFLDMTLDFANISVFHFSKIETENKIEDEKPSFKIEVASAQDRRILMDLGVQNSSVFLSNSTIWVEGITDRLYLRAYMKKYIQELEKNDPEKAILNNFREDYHYSFVEYQGSNLTHWSFDPDEEDIEKIKSSYVCANSFLIADGDVATKGDRERIYKEMLGDRFLILDVKEIENLMPLEVLKNIKKVVNYFNTNNGNTNISNIIYENYAIPNTPIGEYLDSLLSLENGNTVFAEKSGTIKSKVKFCQQAIEIMEDPDFSWKLTDKLQDICQRIFKHIKENN